MTAIEALPFDASSSIWADVRPVPQDDGPAPLCPILYSPTYSQAMDLIRALLPADELSPRALALTKHLSDICPSSFTIWHYRARILIHGPEDGGLGPRQERLEQELRSLDDSAIKHMKTYQVWQHRKLIVSALGDASQELPFINQVLEVDSKNYHTWVYRQWVLAHFGGLPGRSKFAADVETEAGQFPHLWEAELDYIDKLLGDDARNNSAWNHRYFCIFGSHWAELNADQCHTWWDLGKSFDAIVKAEVAFAKGHTITMPNNASAWNYLRGVSRLSSSNTGNPFACALQLAKSLVPSVAEAEKDPTTDAGGRTPPLALEWLLDEVQARSEAGDLDEAGRQSALTEAAAYVKRLCVADPIRRKYWQYRLTIIKKTVTTATSK